MNLKLNLGSGGKNLEGYTNIDISPNADLTWDLEEGLPMSLKSYYESCVEEIRAYHILEHITNLKDLLNDCWEMLSATGLREIVVPRFPHISAVADPTHVRYFVSATFMYFSYSSEFSELYGFKPWAIRYMEERDDIIFCVMVPYTDEIKKKIENGEVKEVGVDVPWGEIR